MTDRDAARRADWHGHGTDNRGWVWTTASTSATATRTNSADRNIWAALETTVTGIGGALLGTATTGGGFGTLVVAILPALQQFGITTGLTIVCAFLASVLVLPSVLVLWTRYLGPSEQFPETDLEGPEPAGEQTTTPDD